MGTSFRHAVFEPDDPTGDRGISVDPRTESVHTTLDIKNAAAFNF
jgi:hypothetical protein